VVGSPYALGLPGAGALERSRRLARREARRAALATALTLLAAALAAAAWTAPAAGRAPLSAVAALALVVALVLKPARVSSRWVSGARGEQATARLLDSLPGGWGILHDAVLPGSAANVDHLVIGRRGVWVVDSKACRAPLRLSRRGLRAGSVPVDTSAVRFEAQVVADRLGLEVAAVVAVHGRGLRRPALRDGVLLVPAGRLVAELRRLDRRAGTPRRTRGAVRDLLDEACRQLGRA
jgi:hypothetical protein